MAYKNRHHKKIRFGLVCLLIFTWLLSGLQTLAVGKSGEGGGGSLPNFLQTRDFSTLVNRLAGYLLMVGIPIAVIMVLYAAVLFLTSGGNEEKVKTAKKALTWAIVGTAVLLVAKGLISLIKDILGAS